MTEQDRILVVDVDGTLMDTNYHHAIAWYRALRAKDVTVPVWRIHRAIGMGGDRLVGHVAGDDVEAAHGDWLRDRWKDEYEQLIDEVTPLPGARDLLVSARTRGLRVVLASSGDPDHVSRYLDQLDARDLADDWTTAEDAASSKPAPDLVHTALDRVGGSDAVLIGDSVWDCRAARDAGIPGVAVLTGGFPADELRDAGAESVFDGLPELTDSLAELPFGG
ncbi:MAG TPA: HAD family hydrolase [Pseudonocardiaceae bacterium]|jgi:HAD superfamily hydrolase (TIGR01549 family)|nr:HAD family hydrolase [Pseudonocardiaceae bacterium]